MNRAAAASVRYSDAGGEPSGGCGADCTTGGSATGAGGCGDGAAGGGVAVGVAVDCSGFSCSPSLKLCAESFSEPATWPAFTFRFAATGFAFSLRFSANGLAFFERSSAIGLTFLDSSSARPFARSRNPMISTFVAVGL
jgi:hypothetical protein